MRNYFPLLLASVWLASVSAGLGILWEYEEAPGRVGSVPAQWPAHSKIPRVPGEPTLIMFAHPKCPCTRASLRELMVLMTHCQHQVNARVLFLQPKGSAEDWLRTDLWSGAEAIPGVMVRADEEGKEAGCFQVATSGHVVLYDADGRLLFSGGITSSRGHSGDNAGRTVLTELIHHQKAGGWETPVFGCSLLNPKPECPAQEAAWIR
jgi:hypothetical protein